MTGSLRSHWEYTPAEIWHKLAEHEQSPLGLFNDLYNLVNDYLLLPGPVPVIEEFRNNPTKAYDVFCELKGTDFTSERAVIEFVEATFEVVSDFGIAGYDEFFKILLRQFLRKYNLRYRLDDPFKLRFLLPGSFSNLYAEIHRVNYGNSHLAGLLRDFEEAFDTYARDQTEAHLKSCIAKASNYAEGLASVTHGTPGTLGALCDHLVDWPHDKVKESLKNLYKFCSDYLGIRHAGNPASQLRVLGGKDSVMISVLLLTFSGYLSPQIDTQIILGS